MSATGIRQLDEIEQLTDEDTDAIDEKISGLPDKRDFCKALIKPLQEGFQTCVDEKEAEAEEGRTVIAEAALAEAKTFAQEASDAKSKAVAALENAKSASDVKGAKGFASDAQLAADNAQLAANSSNDAWEDAQNAESAGDAAVK